MGSNEPKTLSVLVIGAGSAGLLIGQVFKKAGIDVTIFEQDQSAAVRPRDWNFGVYWAQSRLEECLTPELNALVDSVQPNPAYRRRKDSILPVFNGITGEIIKEVPAPEVIRLARKRWLDLIKTGLDVRYGKRLSSISTTEDGVTATFEDGAIETGDLLIGAEGAHSITRNFLFQSNPRAAAMDSLPISSCVTLSTLGRDLALTIQKLHPIFCYIVDSHNQFTWVSLHDCTSPDPAEWIFLLMVTWRTEAGEDTAARHKHENNDLRLEELYARAEHLAYPFRDMLRAVPRGTKVWYNSPMTYWATRPWDNRGGRVTLAGDAAHSMTFHRGQGLGNAIADVAELQTHLRAMKAHTREELAKAVSEYEKEVWKRGYEAVIQNRDNTLAIHDWEKVKESMLLVTGLGKGAAGET